MGLPGAYWHRMLPICVGSLCLQVDLQGRPLGWGGLQTPHPLTGQLTANLVLSQAALGNEPHIPEVWSALLAESDLSEKPSPTRVCSVCNKTRTKLAFWATAKFIGFLGSPLVADSAPAPSDLIRPQRRTWGWVTFTEGTLQSRWTPVGNDSPANIARQSNCQVLLVMSQETRGPWKQLSNDQQSLWTFF